MIDRLTGKKVYMPNDVGWSSRQRFARRMDGSFVFLGYSPLKWSTRFQAAYEMPSLSVERSRLFFAQPGDPWQQVEANI